VRPALFSLALLLAACRGSEPPQQIQLDGGTPDLYSGATLAIDLTQWTPGTGVTPSWTGGIDPTVTHDGSPALFVRFDTPPMYCQYDARMQQQVVDDRFAKQRARIHGWVKGENITSGRGNAFVSYSVGNSLGGYSAGEWSDPPLIGTFDWQPFDIVIDIEPIYFTVGVQLFETGELWISDVVVQVVGRETPIAGNSTFVDPCP
jgi:hypothetical protein